MTPSKATQLLQTSMPLVAILRGLQPERAVETGQVLYEAGFRLIEVPLNRSGAIESIEQLVRSLPSDAVIGAGTVLTASDVDKAAQSGARLIISPDFNPAVVDRTLSHQLCAIPGVATPTEAFAALRAGAHAIKAFPAEAMPPEVIQSWRAVIPQSLPIFAVGSITPERMRAYHQAGVNGFGLGGQLFKPDCTLAQLQTNSTEFVRAWQALQCSGLQG